MKPRVFPSLIPNIEDWPIYKLHKDRKQFIQEIEAQTLERFKKRSSKQNADTLAKTVYLERIRIKEEPWKVDPPNEGQFWRRIGKKLNNQAVDLPEDQVAEANLVLMGQIVHRYAEEIVGTFKISTFLFARRFLTMFFNRLLNTAAGRNFHRVFGSKHRLYERLLVSGEVDTLRSLFSKGTVVVVPTHFSNLDSILIGYALDAVVGLPSFSYGAGLNLYNTGYTAYYMNRLGAYRVDRRKKNPIYLETLKNMSNLALQRGTNSLFFPGGTRSRSGSLETKLKMGLLGSVIEAQRANFIKGKDEKIFIVPLVLSYHFVLEAKYLIEQHLRQTGKERYMRSRDEFYSVRKLLKFAWMLFSESNDIHLSFGKAMDVVGNPVDANGISYDQHGRPVDVKDYFTTDGQVTANHQRESEYTKWVSNRIVERFYKDNIVLSSHLVAFAAFNLLQKQFSDLDVYGLLRFPVDEYQFSRQALEEILAQLKAVLFEMEQSGQIHLSDQIYKDPSAILEDGIRRMGSYHAEKPLRMNKKGEIVSESFHILYFYHNRLDNYGLEQKINWRLIHLPEPELAEP